jgi:hypothetical protein
LHNICCVSAKLSFFLGVNKPAGKPAPKPAPKPASKPPPKPRNPQPIAGTVRETRSHANKVPEEDPAELPKQARVDSAEEFTAELCANAKRRAEWIAWQLQQKKAEEEESEESEESEEGSAKESGI